MYCTAIQLDCILVGSKEISGLPEGYKVECIRYGILLPKFFRPTVRINCSSDRENFLKYEAEFLRSLEHSNSERLEQFLVTECFFNFKLEKNIGI